MASSYFNGQMKKDLSSHPLGLYALSALSVLALSNKEGWWANASAMIVVTTCVLAALRTPASDADVGTEVKKGESHTPITEIEPTRKGLNAGAGPYVPRRYGYAPQKNRNTEGVPRNASPPWRKPPGLTSSAHPVRTHPWKMTIDDTSGNFEVSVPKCLWKRIHEAGDDEGHEVTPREEAVVKVLRCLRQTAEERKADGRKVLNGIRESSRAVCRGRAHFVVVADDLPARFELLDPMLVSLLREAAKMNVPVFKACSRANLGHHGGLGVTASSLVVVSLDAEGAKDAFQELMKGDDFLPQQGGMLERTAWHQWMLPVQSK